MSSQTDTQKYHDRAKDSGNKLKSYILTYSAAATGVFFLALTNSKQSFTDLQAILLITSLSFFFITVVISLIELRVDANRFFEVATQLELAEEQRDWSKNDSYKKDRLKLIYLSYITVAIATGCAASFMICKISS